MDAAEYCLMVADYYACKPCHVMDGSFDADYGASSCICCILQSIYGAFDPDQSRTEDAMADEALTNKEESREALSFLGRLVVIPLVTGAVISRAITEPVLSFSLQVCKACNGARGTV